MLADEISSGPAVIAWSPARRGLMITSSAQSPLGESRLLFEIGDAGADLRDLRQRLVSIPATSPAWSGPGGGGPGPSEPGTRTNGYERPADGGGRRGSQGDEPARRQGRRGLLDPLTSANARAWSPAMAEVHRLLQLAGLQIERVDPAKPGRPNGASIDTSTTEPAVRIRGSSPAASRPPMIGDLVPLEARSWSRPWMGSPSPAGGEAGVARSVAQANVGCRPRPWAGIGRRCWRRWRPRRRELGMTTLRLETNQTLEEAIPFVTKRRLSGSGPLQLRSLRPPLVRERLP